MVQAFKTYQLGGKTSELLYSPATYGVDFGAANMIKPRARRNPLMTVHGNTLWMLGGIVEVTNPFPPSPFTSSVFYALQSSMSLVTQLSAFQKRLQLHRLLHAQQVTHIRSIHM